MVELQKYKAPAGFVKQTIAAQDLLSFLPAAPSKRLLLKTGCNNA